MYDCIVIGGGPAGCTAATLVAAARFKTLLLEGDAHGCWPTGESYARESWGTLRRLGMLDTVSPPTHGDFDAWLLQNAIEMGVERRRQGQECQVLVSHGPGAAPRAIGVRLDSPAGASEEIAGRVIVETGPLRGASDSRSHQPVPAHAALWAYYRGAAREPGRADGDALVVPTRGRRSWFWFAPLPDGSTSVGVVFDTDRLAGRDSPESVLEEELCHCPAVLDRLMDAELASEFHVLRQAPALVPRVAGDGWLVLGDAPSSRQGGLAEPPCPCGLFLALKSGELTADCICRALAVGDTSAEQLSK